MKPSNSYELFRRASEFEVMSDCNHHLRPNHDGRHRSFAGFSDRSSSIINDEVERPLGRGQEGCCCSWFRLRAKRRNSFYSGRACQLMAFGVCFCIVAVCAFIGLLSTNNELGHNRMTIAGITIFSLTGLVAIVASYFLKKILLQCCLFLSIVSTLYAMIWIMAFQVVLATKNHEIQEIGEDIGGGFPYLLASHYLSAGVGAVLGVLSAAFSTYLLRGDTNSDASPDDFAGRRTSTTVFSRNNNHSRFFDDTTRTSFVDRRETQRFMLRELPTTVQIEGNRRYLQTVV